MILALAFLSPVNSFAASLIGAPGDGLGLDSAYSASSGVLAVSYCSSANQLVYGEAVNGVFSPSAVSQLSASSPTAVVFMGSVPHVFFFDSASAAVKHAYQNGGVWEVESVRTGISGVTSISAVVCGAQLCAVYNSSSADVFLTRGMTGGWNNQTIDSAGDLAATLAVTAQPSGLVVAAYYDATNRKPKVAAELADGSWLIETVSFLDRNFGTWPSAAVGPDGTIHLSASRIRSSSTAGDLTLYYGRKKTGGSWEVSEVSTAHAGGPSSIRIGADGYPVISYRHSADDGSDASVVERAWLRASGIWERETLTLPQEVPTASSIDSIEALLVNGSPVAAYRFRDTASGLAGIVVDGLTLSGGSGGSSSGSTSSSGSNPPPPDSSSSSGSNPPPSSSSSSSSGTPPPPGPDNDGDGVSDSLDTDDDNDGLSDAVEFQLGTNPLVADTDRDDVGDGQEQLDGSNPLDRGSVMPVLGTTLCTEWNGFFNGEMNNILEQVNVSSRWLSVDTTLYSMAGVPQSTRHCDLAPGTQCDVLVHDMPGRLLNSYGKVCVTHNGAPGDLDGRMVYYKKQGRRDVYELAFAMPLSNGIKGRQYVSFNTYQPGYASKDQGKLVANWIALTNFSSNPVHGTLRYYLDNGAVLGTQSVDLASGERRDFSGHQFGKSLVGLVEWEPDSSVPVQMRNIRYFYDNAGQTNSFDTAFQMEGTVGSGEILSVPLDTNGRSSTVVELMNTAADPITAAVRIYDAGGALKADLAIPLNGHATYHVIADSLLGANKQGIAVVRGSRRESLIAAAVEYARDSKGSIEYIYNVPAVQALGAFLQGSYNTYLTQDSTIVSLNPNEWPMAEQISLTRFDGVQLLNNRQVIVPPHGLSVFSVAAWATTEQYGVVSVQPDQMNMLAAWALRKRGREYVIATPVRQ